MLKRRRGIVGAVLAVGLVAALVAPAGAATTTTTTDNSNTTFMHAERFDPATGTVLATVDKTVATTTSAGTMADPMVAGSSVAGVKLTPAGMRARSLGSGVGVKTAAAAPGCCSASGGWYISFWVRNGPSWAPNYVFNAAEQFCWGGGVAGVHWGYVFNCSDAPGSAVQPYMSNWFSNTAPVEHNPRISSTNRYFYGWDQMNYSYNTAFYNGTQGAIDVCGGFCYFTRYPSIVITVVANGGYYWSTSAG